MPRLLTFLSLAALAPLVAGAPVPEGKEAVLYFPVQKGTKWVNIWNSEKWKDAEVVEAVTAVEDGKAGAKVVTVGRVDKDGKAYPCSKFEVSARGLFRTENLIGQPLRGPWCALKLPHKQGQTWELDKVFNTRHVAHGPEKVKVPAGEFDAIRVEQRDDRSPDPQQTRWYAAGVGQVKLTQGDLVIALKSFTPGKD